MSNDRRNAELARLWSVQASVNKMVLDGKRDPKVVADIMQTIIDEPEKAGSENYLPTILLELVSQVSVPATSGQFVAKDKFVVNTERDAPVKISNLGYNFRAWFLNGDGKTEDPISEQTLRYHKLRQSSADGSIIAELGGEVKAETTLSEMFYLIEKQKHGEDGVLLNNGWANIFYIKDQNGVLQTVDVCWGDGGWDVGAGPVEYSCKWSVGRQVFSRNSVLES